MLFDPTERNVDPFLFPTRIHTMKELVLTLAIHDKNVTMAKAAQVSFIIRTGLTSPSEDCRAAKTYTNNELAITTPPPKQRFVIAVPTNTRVPSPIKVEVRGSWHLLLSTPWLHQGAIAFHKLASSGQHRFAVCGPTAGPCPYAHEQVHDEPQGTDHAVWVRSLLTPVSCCAEGRKKILQQAPYQ